MGCRVYSPTSASRPRRSPSAATAPGAFRGPPEAASMCAAVLVVDQVHDPIGIVALMPVINWASHQRRRRSFGGGVDGGANLGVDRISSGEAPAVSQVATPPKWTRQATWINGARSARWNGQSALAYTASRLRRRRRHLGRLPHWRPGARCDNPVLCSALSRGSQGSSVIVWQPTGKQGSCQLERDQR